MQENQDKDRSTNEVQSTKEYKKIHDGRPSELSLT